VILKKEVSPEKITTFLNSLNLFGLGFSWGGYKSLVSAGKVKRDCFCEYEDRVIIRISAGLEDKEDLKNDLENALKKIS
jgi:cystathionine beta-lyase